MNCKLFDLAAFGKHRYRDSYRLPLSIDLLGRAVFIDASAVQEVFRHWLQKNVTHKKSSINVAPPFGMLLFTQDDGVCVSLECTLKPSTRTNHRPLQALRLICGSRLWSQLKAM